MGAVFLFETFTNAATRATTGLGVNSLQLDSVAWFHITSPSLLLSMIKELVRLVKRDHDCKIYRQRPWLDYAQILTKLSGGLSSGTINAIMYGRQWSHLLKPLRLELGLDEDFFGGPVPSLWLTKAEARAKELRSPSKKTDRAQDDAWDKSCQRAADEFRPKGQASLAKHGVSVKQPPAPMVEPGEKKAKSGLWARQPGAIKAKPKDA